MILSVALYCGQTVAQTPPSAQPGASTSNHESPPEAREEASPDAPEQLFRIKQIQIDGVSGASISTEQVLDQQVVIQAAEGYQTVADDAEATGTRLVALRDLIPEGQGAIVMDAAGVRGIAQAVFRAYADRQIVAVRVEIPQQTIGNLIEEDGSGVLVIRVIEGRIEALRTVRQDQNGEPVEDADADQDNWFSHVAEQSPVADGDMVRLQEIERYVAWLNRHPGRRVDIALARGSVGDAMALEYIITENRPFGAYFQLSNTGTDETGEWRQRFGLFHHTLTGADDSLTLDYVTSGFDDVHAVTASYSRPIPDLHRVRARVFGSWNTYTASDIGLAGLNLDGEGYSLGGEVIANLYQHDKLFVDAVAGLRYEHTESLNQAIGIPGETGFLLPSVTLRADRRTRAAFSSASIGLETNLEALAGTDSNELTRLGRGNTDTEWLLMRFGASHSFFLEPLFQDDWGEPETGSTRAHEIYLSLQGQRIIGDKRLPASFTGSVGGFYTVRGYPQSFNAMDNTIIATAEYRIHIPALFAPGEPTEVFGRPFRWRPERELSPADWNLMLRAFVDAAHATHNDKLAFESDADMIGAGGGVELSLRHNVRLRADFAWALNEAVNGSDRVSAGDAEAHFELTIAY